MTDFPYIKLISLLEGIKIKDPSPQLPKKIMQVIQETHSIAKLGTTLGTVLICRKDSQDWGMAQTGDVLNPGDQLATGEGGKTFLIYKDGTQLWLNEKTELHISKQPEKIQLSMGELLAFVRKRRFGEDHFILQTPAGRVEVLGTEFDTTVKPDKSSLLTVLKGKVKFQNKFGSSRLRKNDQSSAKPDTKPTVPVKVDVAPVIHWTGDLVNRSLIRDVPLPDRLNPHHKQIPDKPINWPLVILVVVISLIIGYLLGYFYGSM